MRIKHYLMGLACVASMVLLTTSCEDLLSLVNPDEDDDTVENEDPQGEEEGPDKPSSYVLECLEIFNEMQPGIYTFRDGEYTAMVAKGTDGSAFHIPDVNDYFCYYPTQAIKENALPNGFTAFDSDRTHYKFVYGQPSLHKDCFASWQGVDWNSEMIYKLVDEYPTRNAMFAGEGGGELVVIALAVGSNPQKIDDAGDFQETYMKLANRYQKFGNKIGPDKMMPQTTAWNPKGWRSDLYPDEMNINKHVIPYTGKGTYSWMTVNRWMPTGSSTRPPYPCYVDYVEYIEVYLENVPEEDARAYIELVKKEGLITNVVHNEDYTDEVDGKVFQNIWFEANGKDLAEGELGHTYFYPGYEINYIHSGDDFKTLLIKFTTNYTTIV